RGSQRGSEVPDVGEVLPRQSSPLHGHVAEGMEVRGYLHSLVLDLLARLVERSLVIAEPRGAAVRCRLLETLRQYAREGLARRGEVQAVGDRHARYFLARAEEVEPWLERSDLSTWLDELEQEHDNLRAALTWLRDRGEVEGALRLAGALRLFWHLR